MNADAIGALVDGGSLPYAEAPNGLAKFTMPSVPGSYPRRRLFAHFDRLGAKSLVWVAAPAGYGKTTVVSSYLRARSKPTIWYQCDEGDADVGSFFYYLRLARGQFSLQENAVLPTFQPEHLNAIPTFTRNFFRAFFAGLPRGTVLVFDNWQDMGPDAVSTGMLPLIAEQVPDRVKLIVISRADPGANLARLRANEAMGLIAWDRLQLSRSEAGAIAKLRGRSGQPSSRAQIDRIYAVTEGWPAAFTLMLNHEFPLNSPKNDHLQGNSQAVFDYLAAEVFERQDRSLQDFLLGTCCFEHFSVSVAKQVSGRDDAGKILDALTRQNAFTMYRPASSTYYYHPLFRVFLRGRWEERLTSTKRSQSLIAASHALAADGHSEAAIALLLQAQAWSNAALMIRATAESLVRHSRFETLLGWLNCLPSDALREDAWLQYWRGVCELSVAFLSARSTLEAAYRLFVASNDRLGQMLACSAILNHIAYNYADYRPMVAWIEALELLLADLPFFPSVHLELQVQSSFMLALSQALPEHPQLLLSVERVSQLVDAADNLSDQAAGLSALLHFFCRFGRTAQYGELDTKLDRVLSDSTLKPVERLHLLWLHAYQLHHAGDALRVLAILAEARALARHEGLTFEDTRMRICELQAQETEHQPAAAVQAFCELEPWVRNLPPMAVAHFLYVRAIFEMASGDLAGALKCAEEAVPIMRSTHWKIGEALCLTGLGEVYCAFGRFAEATRCVDDCWAIMTGTEAPLVEFNTRLLQTEIARHTSDAPKFTSELSAALRIGREQGYANGFHTSSRLLRTLIPRALQLGIESTYCRWVIAKRGLKPPSCAFENWPWPVKVRAMGNLEISVQEAPLIFGRKTQRKPLDLLKVLTTSISGVDAARIMDWLWPDLDGDAARNALDLALHRLRRMLAHKESVVWKDSHLQLNPDVVWTDVGAFDRLEPCSTEELPEILGKLIALYRGPLLSSERDLAPVIAARERMRDRFIHIAIDLAERLAAAELWSLFSSLYLRALEIEPFEERLHRAFIRALTDQGQADEARCALEHFERVRARTAGGVFSRTLEDQQ